MKAPPLRLINQAVRNRAKQLIDLAPEGYIVTIKEETRTLDQNAKLWPMLADLSSQIEWHGVKLSSDEWKDFATATLKAQKFVPNLEGSGFIAVGGRTSSMGKKKFSDLLEIIYMIGARNEVEWSGESRSVIDEFQNP